MNVLQRLGRVLVKIFLYSVFLSAFITTLITVTFYGLENATIFFGLVAIIATLSSLLTGFAIQLITTERTAKKEKDISEVKYKVVKDAHLLVSLSVLFLVIVLLASPSPEYLYTLKNRILHPTPNPLFSALLIGNPEDFVPIGVALYNIIVLVVDLARLMLPFLLMMVLLQVFSLLNSIDSMLKLAKHSEKLEEKEKKQPT